MPDPDYSGIAPAALPTPPEGPFWTFWEVVSYVDLRDPGSVREAPPAKPPPSPRLRQAITKAVEGIRNGILRTFEFRDIDGVTEFCEVALRRRLDPTQAVIEGFAILTGHHLDSLYDGVFILAADVLAAFPADPPKEPKELADIPSEAALTVSRVDLSEAAPMPPESAPAPIRKRKRKPQTKFDRTKELLLEWFPDGRRPPPRDTLPLIYKRMGDAGHKVALITIRRALAATGLERSK